ncbi:MAG: hypothetical protein IPI42_07700 [Saprospiraceae bacterium]|nr:hypothetical protein [Candidatus Parvibacillus calidus]
MSAPQAQLKVAEQACNSNFSPDYVNEVNFDTLIVSGDKTGVWTYSGVGVDPGSASFYPKDFNGAVPGTYEYTYTITGDPSCAPVSYKINIVVEDCKCPSVAITPFASFCNTVATVDLDSYRVTTKPGKWYRECSCGQQCDDYRRQDVQWGRQCLGRVCYIISWTRWHYWAVKTLHSW